MMRDWLIDDFGQFTNVSVVDEVIHAPSKTPAIDANLSDVVLWQPRATGIRFNDNPGLFDTSYASPPNSIVLSQPLTGSSAIGTATGVGTQKDAKGANFKGDKGWLQSN